jgi:hypothetical protein
MFLKSIDLTTALRPSYLPDEVLLFVQDNVGLYEGYVALVSYRRWWYHTQRGEAHKEVPGNPKSQITRMVQST